MARRKTKWSIAGGLVLALLAGALWEAPALQAVRAIAALSDPAKLASLGERGANSRLNKIVHWLAVARDRGMPAEMTVALAQTLNGTREPRASLVRAALVRNLKIADELGLLTPDNLERLKRGRSATVTLGPYRGSQVEIDHIVPLSLAPEVGNELANLEMLPEPLNLRKSNRVGDRQLAHAEKLAQAGLLKPDSLARIRAHAGPAKRD